MPLIRTLLQITNFRNPYLRTLVPSVAAAFGIQAAVAVPSLAFQTERFYDFSGSLTYLSCTALSLYLPTIRARVAAEFAGKPILPFPGLLAAFTGQGGGATAAGAFNWRQVALSAAVTFWTVRRMFASLFALLLLLPYSTAFKKATANKILSWELPLVPHHG